MQRTKVLSETTLAGAACLVLILAACGSSERSFVDKDSPDGGGMGQAGTGGGSASGGVAGGEPRAGAGGSSDGSGGSSASGGNASGGSAGEGEGEGEAGAGGDSSGCSPACDGERPYCVDGTCVECLGDSKRCTGDTPEECRAGTWVALAPCPANAPACSNGVCAPARITGGLVTAQALSSTGAIRLRDHGFEFLPRACAEVAGTTVCVTGGLRP